MTEALGEIIESTSLKITAESFLFLQPPPLGSLVKAKQFGGEGWIYGVVSFGTTVSIDPGRRVTRRSTPSALDENVYREHPQLEHVLRTEFEAALVGSAEPDGLVHRHLPSQPPPLHYSVYPCSPEEVRAFSEELGYLWVLLGFRGMLTPERLIAAHLREVYRQRGNDRAWLEEAARMASRLFKSEYDKLTSVLVAIEPER